MLYQGPNEGSDSPLEYWSLDEKIKIALMEWIRIRYVKARVTYHGRLSSTSYGMKHEFENKTGFYVSNGAFKGAMEVEGHVPVRRQERNWRFKVKLTEGAKKEEKEIRRRAFGVW